VLAKGNRHDLVSAEATVKKIRVGAKRRLTELNADKGYDNVAFRRHLREQGIGSNIPNGSTSTAESSVENRTTTKSSLSSEHSLNETMPGSNTSGS